MSWTSCLLMVFNKADKSNVPMTTLTKIPSAATDGKFAMGYHFNGDNTIWKQIHLVQQLAL